MKFKFIILFLLITSVIRPQQTADSTTAYSSARGPAADSLNAAKTDTTKKNRSDVDAVIYSSGSDSLIFRVKKKKLEIYGNGELKYKKTELKSANIGVDFQLNQIQATGAVDTSDTAKTKIKGTPVMSENGEIYEGNKLTYNFKTQRGIISGAKNKAEGGLYQGSKVKKITPDAYFIKDGTYTTCDAETSHYFFYSKEMKVITNEQIIGRWIWLYIGGVPFPVPLPFGVFPNQTGRRSGLIAPAYGQSADWGQYFSHFGYFWAISDYMDVNLISDIYFRGGYNLNSNFRYAKRYSLNGNLQLGYSSLKGQGTSWRVGVNHQQTIDPTTNLQANLQFISSYGYVERTSFGRNALLNQTITSNANLYKSWEESGNTISIGYSRTENLISGDIAETLPMINFSKSQAYPFRKKGAYDPRTAKWYEDIAYNYSGRLQNERTKTGGAELISRAGVNHAVNVNTSPKLGYFSFSPVLSYNERWYNKITEIENIKVQKGNIYKDSVVSREVNKLSALRTFSFSLGASTKLYGLVQPRSLGIDAIRHVIIPTLSYSYTPDFSKPRWGYYGRYIDSTGREVRYDKYQGAVFGSVPNYEQQVIGLNISNNIEMKTMKDPSDTTSEAKKIQLISFTLSTGYNFAAGAPKRLSDLSLTYHTQVANLISLSGSSSYSFYDYDYATRKESTRYLASRSGGGLFRLMYFNVAAGLTLSAETFKASSDKKTNTEKQSLSSVNRDVRSEYTGQYYDESPDYSIPWDMSLNINYSMNKSNPENVNKTTNLSGNLNFNLTQSLKISMTSNYDLNTHQFLYPEIRVFKDLHCWEMNFTWNPIGSFAGYRFEIRVKASQLRDLKVEKSYGQYIGR
ncbi:MAG: putative LPS assembly protein LptD [Bacillota bacterium]